MWGSSTLTALRLKHGGLQNGITINAQTSWKKWRIVLLSDEQSGSWVSWCLLCLILHAQLRYHVEKVIWMEGPEEFTDFGREGRVALPAKKKAHQSHQSCQKKKLFFLLKGNEIGSCDWYAALHKMDKFRTCRFIRQGFDPYTPYQRSFPGLFLSNRRYRNPTAHTLSSNQP